MENEIFKKIILCFDNSKFSFYALDTTLNIAKTFNSEVVGVHGYNATMHEDAFRIMEPILPKKYQNEDEIIKQRQLHAKLISIGMEKISLSYLKPLSNLFRKNSLSFNEKVREGKNFKAVTEMIEEEKGGLIIMGSSGFNHSCEGFLGSVCIRTIRKVDTNFLVVKKRLISTIPNLLSVSMVVIQLFQDYNMHVFFQKSLMEKYI